MIIREKDYLMHYGVLGMKWGVHRSKVNAQKAREARRTGDSSKAKYYENKSKAIRKKHEKRSGKQTVKRVENMSVGKALVQSFVFGTYGALKYNQARAKDKSRCRAAVNGILGYMGNNLTIGGLSVVEPRIRAKRNK